MQNLEFTTFKRKFQVYYTYQKLFSLTKSKKKITLKRKSYIKFQFLTFVQILHTLLAKKKNVGNLYIHFTKYMLLCSVAARKYVYGNSLYVICLRCHKKMIPG